MGGEFGIERTTFRFNNQRLWRLEVGVVGQEYFMSTSKFQIKCINKKSLDPSIRILGLLMKAL